jgi:hypothetical protein
MYDVTKDVIDYFKDETRDEEEFQKVWAELVKWKADRDEEMKKQLEEEARKAKAEAQIREKKLETLRDKAAAAQAQYMVELYAGTSSPCEFDKVYQESLKAMLDSEKVVEFVKALEEVSKKKKEAGRDAATLRNKTDDDILMKFLGGKGWN